MKDEDRREYRERFELDKEDDNALITIPEDNIYMEFEIGEQSYIAFSEQSSDEEELDMMFAKVDMIDGMKIIRNIEDDAEYERVVKEFNDRLELFSGLGEKEDYGV